MSDLVEKVEKRIEEFLENKNLSSLDLINIANASIILKNKEDSFSNILKPIIDSYNFSNKSLGNKPAEKEEDEENDEL